jgi:lipopolysaccharide biosynthesis glycosyltransferase
MNKSYLTIPIVLSTDEQYAPFLYTTMLSILEHANENTFYAFYILVPNNFSKVYQDVILRLKKGHKCIITFIFIENIFEKIARKIQYITSPTYYRLLIGDIFPEEFVKCIYLDVDICVNKDLSELFNIDIGNNYIAGVVDPRYFFSEKKNCKRLNLPSMKYYVNAGVLLMNIKQIREDNMTQKFIKLTTRTYDFQEQDILNIACYGKILTLPPKYNALITRLKENNPILRNLYSEQDIIEANNSPHIIHYIGVKKPWKSFDVYMEKYWWKIAKKTPFINSLFNRDKIYKNELKKWWYRVYKKSLNIDNPITFNEKIQWLKLHDSTPIKTRLSDKYLVRSWVKDKIGEKYLIPLLGVYDKFEDIDFKKLPNKFVIKCNHGSGYNIIVKNKSELKLQYVKIQLNKWMSENFAFKNGLELHYRDIEQKIIIEKYMDDGTGDIRDYKFHCFNGIPKFIWIDCDRHTSHQRSLYNLKWNPLPFKINPHYSKCPPQKKPKLLDILIKLSSILSKDFAYSRVDFYIINEKIFFGEITFTSTSGYDKIKPDYFDRKLGSFIKFPMKTYNIDTGKYTRLTKISLYPLYFLEIAFILKLLFSFFHNKKFNGQK